MKTLIEGRPDRRAGDIQATGSMAPTLDENQIVVVEKTPFARLTRGRNTVFRGSWTRNVLCHRHVRRGAEAWVTNGDRLEAPDPYPMTAKTYAGFIVIASIHKETGAVTPL